MQKSQGYCTYCRVNYTNLEQHLFSAQHRSVARQSRHRIISNNSLMERFLQDVLRHHPYNYQDSRLTQHETTSNTGSSEVMRLDAFLPEDQEFEDISSDSCESDQELQPGPSVRRNSAKGFSVRPSVIQKLEKGQQQALELVPQIESDMKRISLVDIGQTKSSGKAVVRLPVICNAPARRLPGSSFDRPVAASTSGLSLEACSSSASRRDPNRADSAEQPDGVSRNRTPSSQPGASSVSYESPKESNRKPVRINADKLVWQKDVRSQGDTPSPGFTFRELKGAKSSVRVESSSKVAVGSAVKVNKTDMLSVKGILEGAIPKHREEFRLSVGYPQEQKRLVSTVSSKMKFDYSPLPSTSSQSQQAYEDCHFWREEEHSDQDSEDSESRSSEMSFDCNSSCPSMTSLSEATPRDLSLSEELHADCENYEAWVSEISSDDEDDDSLEATANESEENVEESPPNTPHVSLVHESYDSSDSDMYYDCDESFQAPDDVSQEPVIEVVFPQGVPVDLVDRRYGSSSSEGSATSLCSAESVFDEPPLDDTEKKLRKECSIWLVDKSYGSSFSESSSDNDSSQPDDDCPQKIVKKGKQKDNSAHLKNKNQKPSSATAHLAHGVTYERERGRARSDVGEKYHLKKKNADLVDMNCESHAPEMCFHDDTQLVADESQVAEVNTEKVDIDLENESGQSSISDLSFDSHDFLYQSVDDQPEGAVGEVNLKELSIDMEVKSCGYSSSELTFDSDSPLLSFTERSQLDVERMKEDGFNLEEESCESNSSDLTFDSDISTCSVVEQPQVAVYEEEPVDLENKSNESCISEITFDSDIPLHSGNDQPEVAVKEVIIQEEEYVHLGKKNNKPNDCEISSNSYAPLHSVTNPLEVAAKKLNSQKEQQVFSKNKENEPTASEISLNCDLFHSKTGHSDSLFKDFNLQKEEHIHLEKKGNELLGVCGRLDSDTPLQSVIHKPKLVVKNTWLHEEKHAEFQNKSAEKHVYLEGENTQCRAFEVNLNVGDPLHSIIDQPQPAPLKQKHIERKDKDRKPGDAKISLNSGDCLRSLPERYQMVKKINRWKEEACDLEKKINETNFPKVIHDSDPFHSVADEPEVAIKQVNFENEDQMYLESKSQCSCSDLSFNSDLVQAVGDQPHLDSELESKQTRSCDSELRFDSDDSFYSVGHQFRETMRETSFWDEEDVGMEDERGEAKGFESTYNSDASQSATGQTGVIQEVILWKKHVDLEDKNVKTSDDSKISFNSNEVPPSVTDKIEAPTKEIHHMRKGYVCLDDKGSECDGSGIIYAFNIPPKSMIQQPQSLQEKHANLEIQSSALCDSDVSSDSSEPPSPPSVAGHLREADASLKEDHIYLENKSYKLVDYEASCDSDVPVQFVVDHSPMSPKEVNLEKQAYNDQESENCEPCLEMRYDSGVHLHSEDVQPQVACRETDLQKEELVNMEEKASGPNDSELMDDNDISFQIIVNHSQSSDEADSPDVVFVDVLPNDSDCDREVISDPDVPLQLETDPPQLTISEPSYVSEESVDTVKNYCDFCNSEFRDNSESSSQSMTSQSKKTFKIINQKNDYIILGGSTCHSCGHEIDFNDDSSDSVTNQSPEPGQEQIDLEDRVCESGGLVGNFSIEGTSQAGTDPLQKDDTEVNFWNNLKNPGLKRRAGDLVDCTASSKSVICHTADQENLLKLPHTVPARKRYKSCLSRVNSLYDSTLQPDLDLYQEAMKKTCLRKRVTFNLNENIYIPPSPDPSDVSEEELDDLLIEDLPHAPPSSVGKTWPQLTREDDTGTNIFGEEFKEDHFQGYFHDDCEPTKVFLSEETNDSWPELNEDSSSVPSLSSSDDIAGGSANVEDLSGILDAPLCSSPLTKELTQNWHAASHSQASEVSHPRQTQYLSYPLKKRKIPEQKVESPKKKCLRGDRKGKKKAKTATVELPVSSTQALEPRQPHPLVCNSPSVDGNPKESVSFSSPRKKDGDCDKQLQFKSTCEQSNLSESLPKKNVTPPQTLIVLDSVSGKRTGLRLFGSELNCSAGDYCDNVQNLPSTPLRKKTARYELRSCGNRDSSVFGENAGAVDAGAVPKDCNSQPTPLSQVVTNVSPQSVSNESQSQNLPVKKVATNSKSGFPGTIYKKSFLPPKNYLPSKKQAIWIQTKANDIIRKYILNYSGFLRRKYQPKNTIFAMHLNKKIPFASRLIQKKMEPSKMLLNSSVPPTGFQGQSGAIVRPSREQPPRRCKNVSKDYYRQQKKRPLPIRAYQLRSSCHIPDADKMMTRLSIKMKSNEVK
ncbi:DBF4-type zinc finger-containing protein 2 [Ctenodactylus gundi]